ncbi:MAG: DUF1080 domain-containing protein [Verrucomicrobiales bacterium]|nr:DUF1080 domain-containing protein [Verrucomicrobiales bacterium]
MKTRAIHPFPTPAAVLALLAGAMLPARCQPLPLGHDRNRPLPPVVAPGHSSTQDQAGSAPSDAVVLFAGGELSAWCAMDGTPTRWVVKDGAMECVPGSGYIRSQQCFGECQLHLEFATPTPPEGSSQGRGNSGVFFGGARYEIQVLDSHENKTYADGSCGSIYNQYPPQVNASRPPGQWQSYDILWSPPKFDAEGTLLAPARVTAFHNGVLIHHNAELVGGTGWLQRAPYQAHPEKLPLALQDHGNPVRYRNIWVRELGPRAKPEFQLADRLLDSYCGRYQIGRRESAEFTRGGSGLRLKFQGVEFDMFAESPTHFFAKTVDVQAEFSRDGDQQKVLLTIGEDEGGRRGTKAP